MTNLIIIFGAKYLVFVILILATIYFFKQDNFNKKKIFIFSLISLPLIFIIAKIASHFYFNPRPFVVGNFTPLIPHAPDNGFPSDHTLLSSAVAMIIFYFNKKIGLLLLFLAILVGASRVLANIHHPLDIIGSLLIPILSTLLVNYFVVRYIKLFNNK